MVQALLPLLAGFIVLASSPVTTRAQVQACTQKMVAIGDGRLQSAIDALRAKHPDLVLEADDACRRAKATTRALAATLGRNYLKRPAGFEYVKVVAGESYFTVERFVLPKVGERKRLLAALKKCRHCKLEIPENTCLAHFVAGDSVVLMIAAAAGCKDSREKFRLIERAFLAPATTSSAPSSTSSTPSPPPSPVP